MNRILGLTVLPRKEILLSFSIAFAVLLMQLPCTAHTVKHKKRTKPDEINPISVVQDLISQGKLKQASKLLDGVEGDKSVIESFKGIISVKSGRLEEAVEHFKVVLDQKPNQTAVWLYMGQCYFKLGRYKDALKALENGESIGKSLPSYFLMKARTQQELELVEDAYETLEKARKSFPGEHVLLREQALLLVRAKLYKAALKKGFMYLDKMPDDRYGYMVLGEALRKAGRNKEAQAILEKAALFFKDDPEVVARLALAYSSDGRNMAAARLFERAVMLGGDYAFAAAECYRLAGDYRHALELNSLVRQAKKKLGQRLAIYLGWERFQRAASLLEPLEKAKLLDDTSRYRLAYALMRSGDLDRAERLCREMRDPVLTDSASRLEQAIMNARSSLAAEAAKPGGPPF